MLVPFSNTVELVVKPVPYSATVATVFTSPEFGESDVSVGTGGFAIVTVTAFDKAGVEVELLTVMVAVPADASRLAGTVATTNSGPELGIAVSRERGREAWTLELAEPEYVKTPLSPEVVMTPPSPEPEPVPNSCIVSAVPFHSTLDVLGKISPEFSPVVISAKRLLP
jgi:hypothetical protein